jgi:hypothetical protein
MAKVNLHPSMHHASNAHNTIEALLTTSLFLIAFNAFTNVQKRRH